MTYRTYHVFFRNLSNELKVRIVAELKKKDLCVNNLREKLNVEQSKLSHALASLKSCGIVNSMVDGKKRVYSLNKKTVLPILNIIDRHGKEFCKGNCEECQKYGRVK